MADTVHSLAEIAKHGPPPLEVLKALANQAARDPGAFFQTDYATVRKALTCLVDSVLNQEAADTKTRTATLTLLANLSKETSYAPVIMEAVQTLSEG